MAQNYSYIPDLNIIIELIKENKIDGADNALEKFKIYLDLLENLGSFDIQTWNENWRALIWRLGEEFKNCNPQKFLNLIDIKLAAQIATNKEVFEFIKSEITFNFLPSAECKTQIEKLIVNYPTNPEFRHTLGHFYKNEKEYLKAINEYQLALRIDPNNSIFISSCFYAEHDYLNHLISENEFALGKEYIENVFKEKKYLKQIGFHNAFIDFQARFQDHTIFQKKLKTLEEDFKSKMQDELDSERKRIIEVVGFFSGIVAFILSTVSIGEKFSFIEAVCFLIALGLVLIIFAVSLSILFNSSKKKLFEDKKFWILVGGILGLFLYLFILGSIANIGKIL